MILKDISPNENEYNEYKVKEKLYTLFYELTSEIKGIKIEIDEDDYEENIRTTNVFQIIEYIYQTLQILLDKYKNDNNLIFKPNDNEINQYEKILRKYENDKRKLIKRQFQQKLHRESLEYKLEEYMEMEEEFEEMKTKLKYEDNLKVMISKLENDILVKDKLIEELKEKYNSTQIKLEETEKELNLFSNIDINNVNNLNNNSNLGNNSMINFVQKNLNNISNISIISHKNNNSSNITKNSFCLCKNNISEIKNIFDLKIFNLKSTKTSTKKNKHIHELFGNNKNIISDLSIKKINTNKKKLYHNRNNSMNILLEKKKMNLISKYLSNKKSNRTTINTNNNSNKKKKGNNYKNLTCRTKKQSNNTCLKIIKKIPFISQKGNLTNRSLSNKHLKRNTSFKNQKNPISKIIKLKYLVNSNTNFYNKASTSISTSRVDFL